MKKIHKTKSRKKTKYHKDILKKRNSKPKNEIYDLRYGENWVNLSKICKESLDGKCCYPNCRNNAKEAHHAMYKDIHGAIANREIIGTHVFPLCMRHHVMAHNPRNWNIGKLPPPKLDSKNTENFIEKLKKGFNEKLKK